MFGEIEILISIFCNDNLQRFFRISMAGRVQA
jgi:hypothetical protein